MCVVNVCPVHAVDLNNGLCVGCHLSLSDFTTSGGFATVFLTGGSLPYQLFNGPEVLTTSTDKANLFARIFSCNSTLDDGSQQLPVFPFHTEQRLSSKNITAKMVSNAIYHLDASKTTGPNRIPAIVLTMCSC